MSNCPTLYADNGRRCTLDRAPKQFDVHRHRQPVRRYPVFRLRSDVGPFTGHVPSASLGARMPMDAQGALRNPSTARGPSIRGQGKANPIALYPQLCHGAALFLLTKAHEARGLGKKPLEQVLADGGGTADLMGPEGGLPYPIGNGPNAILAALDREAVRQRNAACRNTGGLLRSPAAPPRESANRLRHSRRIQTPPAQHFP